MVTEKSHGWNLPPSRSPTADHFFAPEMVGETQGTAAQWRETGPEDHAVIRILGRGDDLFLEATRGFVDHQVNEAEREVRSRDR